MKTVWIYRNEDWIEVSPHGLDPEVPYRLKSPARVGPNPPPRWADAAAPSAPAPGVQTGPLPNKE